MKKPPIVCVHQKMTAWIFLFHGLLVVFYTAEAQENLEITKFERAESNTVSVCVGNPLPKAKKYVLTLKPDASFDNSSDILNDCIPFGWDIAGNTGLTQITLEAKNFLGLVIGSDDLVINIPEFPELTSSKLVNQSASYNILRIKGDKKTFSYQVGNDFSAIDEGNSTEYYFGYDEATSTMTPCADPLIGTVSICDMPLSPAPVDSKGKIKVDSAILKYNDDNTHADITLSISNDETKIDLKSLDIIVQSTTTNKLCIGRFASGITDSTCTVPWTVGSHEADLRLVEKNIDDLFDYKEHLIKDCELLAGGLDDTTLEVRWLQFGTKKYKLTAIKDDGTEAGSIEVDCSAFELEHCFAYFILTSGAKYSVRLQEYESIVSYKKDSQIQSKTYSLPSLSRAKKIHQVELEWLPHYNETWAIVCFNHSDTSSIEQTAFSRYEFVMINGKGQWLKHQLITEETGARCFTPLVVDMNDFDVSQGAKLIVTQRAKDGFTVLASATSPITF